MLCAVAGQLAAPSGMTDECGWQPWSSQLGDPVGLVRDLWSSFESWVGPRCSLVVGKMRRPVPVPHVQRTRGGASRGRRFVGVLLRDAHSASSSGACAPTGARPWAGSCPPAGWCWLRCWVSCWPGSRGWSACRYRVRRRRPVLEASGAPDGAVISEHASAARSAPPDLAATCGAWRPFGVTMCRDAAALWSSCS